jgi:hypothetical protein
VDKLTTRVSKTEARGDECRRSKGDCQSAAKEMAVAKKAAGLSTPEAATKPKRKLSAAGRKAIIAATKKRLALKRAEAAKAS